MRLQWSRDRLQTPLGPERIVEQHGAVFRTVWVYDVASAGHAASVAQIHLVGKPHRKHFHDMRREHARQHGVPMHVYATPVD